MLIIIQFKNYILLWVIVSRVDPWHNDESVHIHEVLTLSYVQ
jgi:hypothetical protein